jgi:hypothetical protein
MIPRAPTQLLPDNIGFEDALGRVQSLPYAWFRHWEVFEGFLRAEFKHMPVSALWYVQSTSTNSEQGERKVEAGQYQVISTKRTSALVTSQNWAQSIFPGSNISMSIIMAHLRMEAGMCPRQSCKGKAVANSVDAIFVNW